MWDHEAQIVIDFLEALARILFLSFPKRYIVVGVSTGVTFGVF